MPKITKEINLIIQNIIINKSSFLSNLLVSICVFSGVAVITRDGVGDTFEQSKCFMLSMGLTAILLSLFSTCSVWNNEKNQITNDIQNNLFTPYDYIVSHIIPYYFISTFQGIIGAAIIVITMQGKISDTSGLLGNFITDLICTMILLSIGGVILGLLLSVIIANVGLKRGMITLAAIVMAQLLLCGGIFELNIPELRFPLGNYEIDLQKSFYTILDILVVMRSGLRGLCSIININNLPLKLKLVYPMIEQPIIEMFVFTGENLSYAWRSILINIIIYTFIFYRLVRKETSRIDR